MPVYKDKLELQQAILDDEREIERLKASIAGGDVIKELRLEIALLKVRLNYVESKLP